MQSGRVNLVPRALLERLAQIATGDGRIPGLGIGIVYKRSVVYLNGFGVPEMGKPELIDPDTVFQLASACKPLSSTVLSSLVSDGTVNWDDPVAKYDPEFQHRIRRSLQR